MIKFLKSRFKAFDYAFAGLNYLVRTQEAVTVHIIANVLIFSIAFWVGLERIEWILLILTVMVVWAAEILNTAVESVVDMVTEDFHPLAKAAKDLGASAVFVTASCAILIGFLLIGPPLWEKLGF